MLTKLCDPPLRIWILYARKMIGGVSPENTFLLTTYADILPSLPLLARRMLTDGSFPRKMANVFKMFAQGPVR